MDVVKHNIQLNLHIRKNQFISKTLKELTKRLMLIAIINKKNTGLNIHDILKKLFKHMKLFTTKLFFH